MKTEVHLYGQAQTGIFKGMNRFMTLVSMLMVLSKEKGSYLQAGQPKSLKNGMRTKMFGGEDK